MLGSFNPLVHWEYVHTRLIEKKFIIAFCPSYYKKSLFCDQLRKEMMVANKNLVQLKPYDIRSLNGVKQFWESFSAQLNLPKKSITDEYKLLNEIRKSVINYPKDILIVLNAEGIGKESQMYEVANLLYNLIEDKSNHTIQSKISILIIDDYTLFFYERLRTQDSSRWDYFQRIHISPFNNKKVEVLLPSKIVNKTACVESIMKFTSGHCAFVEKIVAVLYDLQEIDENNFEEIILGILLECEILEVFKNILIQDFTHYYPIINYYKLKRITESNKPDINYLIHLGIILKIDAFYSICPKIIVQLIEEIAESQQNLNINTNTRDVHLSEVISDDLLEIEINDDDFIVIHLSDIHIGDKYLFRIDGDINSAYNRSIVDIFIKDINKLNLKGRIDALVVSGDFTETAEWSEFLKSQILIEKLLDVLGLRVNQLIVIPGNHDIQWKPEKFNNIDPLTGISRDNFNSFLKILNISDQYEKKSSFNEITFIKEVFSKSGNRILRILGMDSNLIEGPKASGIGYIGNNVMQDAYKLLEESNQRNKSIKNISTWITTHHHVFPATSPKVQSAYNKNISLIANTAQLLSFANHNNVEMILHGHEHQPSITITRRWPSSNNKSLHPLVSLGAGSFGGNESITSPYARNQYYIIYDQKDRSIIRSRSLIHNAYSFNEDSNIVISKNI